MIWGIILLSAVLTVSILEIKAETTLDNMEDADKYDVEIVSINWKLNDDTGSEEAKYIYFNTSSPEGFKRLRLVRAVPGLTGPNTPVYKISRDADGKDQIVKFDHVTEIMNTTIYEDYYTKASIAITRLGCQRPLTGFADSFTNIAPPDDSHKMRRRRSLDQEDGAGELYELKSPSKLRARRSMEAAKEVNFVQTLHYSDPNEDQHGAHNKFIEFFPKVLIIVDSSYLKLIPSDHPWILIPHLMAMWNRVDMKYRSLELGGFQFNIAGIIIPTDGYEFSYVQRNKVSVGEHEYIVFERVLKGMEKWLQELDDDVVPRDSYDFAVTITPYEELGCSATPAVDGAVSHKCKVFDGIRLSNNQRLCHTGPENIKPCMVLGYTRKSGIGAIHIAAHEFGHLMGFQHTADETCDLQGDNIMYPDVNVQSWNWSNCTKADFQKFLKSDVSCLRRKPDVGN